MREEKGAPFPITSKPALQKAETEWKTAFQIPAAPKSRQKTGSSRSAPRSSAQSVTRTAKPAKLTMPLSIGAAMASRIALRWFRVSRFPASRATEVATVSTPRPPIWIRISTIACPKPDQWVAVSTTTRPVTQTAETEVNRDVKKGVARPSAAEIGRQSSRPPRRITPAKPRMIR